jgi:hypothetical protein
VPVGVEALDPDSIHNPQSGSRRIASSTLGFPGRDARNNDQQLRPTAEGACRGCTAHAQIARRLADALTACRWFGDTVDPGSAVRVAAASLLGFGVEIWAVVETARKREPSASQAEGPGPCPPC